MSILQKITLSLMVVTVIFSVIFGLAVMGSDIQDDEKAKKIYAKCFSRCFIIFLLSTIVFVLGSIWR